VAFIDPNESNDALRCVEEGFYRHRRSHSQSLHGPLVENVGESLGVAPLKILMMQPLSNVMIAGFCLASMWNGLRISAAAAPKEKAMIATIVKLSYMDR
jgi:hypothetical protein